MTGRVDRRLQVVRRQRRVELIERGDLPDAGAEGDAGGGAAAGRADRQRLAAERGRNAGGGAGSEAERREHVARAGDRQILARAGAEHELAAGNGRGRARAGDAVDRAQYRLHRECAAGTDADRDVAEGVGGRGGLRGREGDRLAVDSQDRTVGNRRTEIVRTRTGGTDQLGRARDRRRAARIVIVDDGAGDRVVGVCRAAAGCWRSHRGPRPPSRWIWANSPSGSAAPGWRSIWRCRPAFAAR